MTDAIFMTYAIYLLLYILLCIRTSGLASTKAIAAFEVFVWSIIFTPLVGLLMCIASPVRQQDANDAVTSDYATQLQYLISQRDQGIISQDEFKAKRSAL